MLAFFSKILGLVIAATIILFVVASKGSEAGIEVCFLLLLPLAMIWFPDKWGLDTGRFMGYGFDHESSPIAVSLLGWFLLVGFGFWFVWLFSGMRL